MMCFNVFVDEGMRFGISHRGNRVGTEVHKDFLLHLSVYLCANSVSSV